MSALDPKTYLWRRLEQLVGGAGLSLDQMASKTGASRGTVQRIKEAQTSVGMDVLLKIADHLGVEVWQLLRPPEDEERAGQLVPVRQPISEATLIALGRAVAELPAENRVSATQMLHTYFHSPVENEDMVPLIVRRALGGLASSGASSSNQKRA